nr:hypothetical protein [Bradyrhizobium diazoefficiens]
MNRYFFDIQSGRDFFADEEGLPPQSESRRSQSNANLNWNRPGIRLPKQAGGFGSGSALEHRTAVLRFDSPSELEHQALKPVPLGQYGGASLHPLQIDAEVRRVLPAT